MKISSFDRVAYNLANMGYYPTSEGDCRLIGTHLDGYDFTILDPCCGTGHALKSITDGGVYCTTVGIEIEEGRYKTAKELLSVAIHEDFFNLSIEHRAFGAIFLNPPYNQNEKLHLQFIEKSTDILADDGILALILSDYEFTGKTARFLASFYKDISIHKATDQRFRQAIFFGKKRTVPLMQEGKEVETLTQTSEEIKRIIHAGDRYEIPQTKEIDDIRILVRSIDPGRLKKTLDSFDDDWKKVIALIPESAALRRPLLPLRRGHLAQILASGLIDGVISHPATGEKYLIKGTTKRIEEVVDETEEETRIISKDVVTILMMDRTGNIEKIK